jgi:hypothetical protein
LFYRGYTDGIEPEIYKNHRYMTAVFEAPEGNGDLKRFIHGYPPQRQRERARIEMSRQRYRIIS